MKGGAVRRPLEWDLEGCTAQAFLLPFPNLHGLVPRARKKHNQRPRESPGWQMGP